MSRSHFANAPSWTWLALGACLLAVFMQLLDATILTIALPAIGRNLTASGGQIELVATAYTLGFASVLLLCARLGDGFGRRRMFVAGMVVFVLASVACAMSANVTDLIGARVVQGLAAAMMAAQTLAIITEMFDPMMRTTAFALYGATAGLASILGPNLGGALLSADLFGLGWRTIFLLNLPLGIVTILLGYRYIPSFEPQSRRRLDLVGVGLSSTALLLLVLALELGRENGWATPFVAMLAGGPLLIVLFVRHERRLAAVGQDPLLRIDMFKHRSFAFGCLICVVLYGCLTTLVLTVSFTLQAGVHLSASQTALMTLPFALGALALSSRSSLLWRRFDSGLLVFGTLTLGLSLLAMALLAGQMSDTASLIICAVSLLAAGVGAGALIAPLQTTAVRDIPSADLSGASGMMPTVQQVGCALGFAFAGSVFFARLPSTGVPTPAEYVDAQRLVLALLAAALFAATVLARRIAPAAPHESSVPTLPLQSVPIPAVDSSYPNRVCLLEDL